MEDKRARTHSLLDHLVDFAPLVLALVGVVVILYVWG
jgi:hypothetical protein